MSSSKQHIIKLSRNKYPSNLMKIESQGKSYSFYLKKYTRMFVFIRETAIFAPLKINDTRFGSSAG